MMYLPYSFTDYFMTYLGEILRAIHEDNLPIAGTFAWGECLGVRSLTAHVDMSSSAMVDNAEWNSGLSARSVPITHNCAAWAQLSRRSPVIPLTCYIYRFGIQHVNYTTLERTYKRSALSLCELFCKFISN